MCDKTLNFHRNLEWCISQIRVSDVWIQSLGLCLNRSLPWSPAGPIPIKIFMLVGSAVGLDWYIWLSVLVFRLAMQDGGAAACLHKHSRYFSFPSYNLLFWQLIHRILYVQKRVNKIWHDAVIVARCCRVCHCSSWRFWDLYAKAATK